MSQTVELLLDAEAEARVVADWVRLDDAGLASQAQHREASNRPHLTLAAAGVVPADVEPALARACAQALPLSARLGAVVLFGGDPVVLARLVVPSGALLDLHAAVAGRLGVPDTLRPDRWTPHVTLARRMRRDQLTRALEVLAPVETDVRFEAARRWDGAARQEWPIA